MNNHFLLDLDTTAPNVEIYAPYFTTPNATVYIFVEADEPLDNWREIYTIDSAGTRRDHIFHFDGNNQFMGEISMIDYPEGNVTICARVRDTVHNTSHLVEKTMLVTSGARVHLGSDRHTYDGIGSGKIRASEAYNDVQRIVESSMTLEADKPYFMTSRRSYGLFDITVNGIKDSYPTPDDIAYNPGNYSIRSLGCYTPGSACFSGNLSFAAIYDRILTDAEIERNYRVLKREMAKVGVTI